MQSAQPTRKLHDEVLYVYHRFPTCHRAFTPVDLYHAMTWPSLSYVAEDHKGRIVGYILAKMYIRQPSGDIHAYHFHPQGGNGRASGGFTTL